MGKAGPILCGTMAALFAFAAIVQFNDPDPVRWIALYAAACAASLLAAMRRPVPAAVSGMLAVIALAWAAAILAGAPPSADYLRMFDAWEMGSLEVEEAREASGLGIVGVWMVILTCRTAARRRGQPCPVS